MREETLNTEIIYDGRVVKLELVDVRLENGTETKREVIRHSGAVVVLARRADGRFLFVRQFRKPVEQELLEAVAGTLEAGESPDDCARRELLEETGFDAGTLRHLGTCYPSPGYVDERMEFYFAELEGGGGELVLDHDEHIVPVMLSRGEVLEKIRGGEILDAKTLAIWLLYEKIVGEADSDGADG